MDVETIAKEGLRFIRDTFLGAFNHQVQLIHKDPDPRNPPWNYIIILDACRYDYFKRAWHGAPVHRVTSPGSNTHEWVRRTWPSKYEYRLYSCNPFMNSKGLGHWGYHAKDHFKKVIDLWLTHWDEEKGTVPPGAVVDATWDAPPRSIIWFIQPHAPYLSWGKSRGHPDGQDFINWTPDRTDELYPRDPRTHRVHYGINVIKVVQAVQNLITNLEPPILITSDHGELLGEGGIRGHPGKSKRPELRHVPVVIIE